MKIPSQARYLPKLESRLTFTDRVLGAGRSYCANAHDAGGGGLPEQAPGTICPKSKVGIGGHIRIAFVVNAHEYTAVHRLPLLLAARERGWTVTVIAPEGSQALARLKREGFAVESLALSRRGIAPWSEWGAVRTLKRLYSELRPDLVHHATIKPVIYGTIAARRAGVPAVVNAITGLGYVYAGNDWRARILRRMVNPLYRFALRHPNQRIIFQNSDDQRVLQSIRAARASECVLIPGSGVDVDCFQPEPESTGVSLAVLPARMLRDKGVGEFVEAARRLRRQGSKARFALVGDLDPDSPSGIREEKLKAWVQEGVVEWWGHVDDMQVVYRDAHVVVLPSYYREGMPKVLLEAAASGRPVIAADTPGCRDAVTHGQTGFLVPARDPLALAERMRQLLEEPSLREAMGRAGRIRAEEEFSTKRIIAETMSVYEQLLRAVK